MSTNVGKTDRVLRLLVGIALIAAPLLNFMGLGANAWTVYVLVAVGAVLTVTSVVGICPLYSLIGVKTSDA